MEMAELIARLHDRVTDVTFLDVHIQPPAQNAAACFGKSWLL
jgi:hypothetical protein